ncbi:hypothetical protein BVX98_04930 [bacterium F11]|nr:hypothetical protein BVX98_04930 [bacterium F11]
MLFRSLIQPNIFSGFVSAESFMAFLANTIMGFMMGSSLIPSFFSSASSSFLKKRTGIHSAVSKSVE